MNPFIPQCNLQPGLYQQQHQQFNQPPSHFQPPQPQIRSVDSNLPTSNKAPLKFPSQVHEGGDILRVIGVKQVVGMAYTGDYQYAFESVIRNESKCRFEIISNMPLDGIVQPAIQVLSLQLNVYQVDKQNQKKLLISFNTSNMGAYQFHSASNKPILDNIVSIVGIDKITSGTKDAWKILMDYIGFQNNYCSYDSICGWD